MRKIGARFLLKKKPKKPESAKDGFSGKYKANPGFGIYEFQQMTNWKTSGFLCSCLFRD